MRITTRYGTASDLRTHLESVEDYVELDCVLAPYPVIHLASICCLQEYDCGYNQKTHLQDRLQMRYTRGSAYHQLIFRNHGMIQADLLQSASS